MSPSTALATGLFLGLLAFVCLHHPDRSHWESGCLKQGGLALKQHSHRSVEMICIGKNGHIIEVNEQ